MGLFLLGLPAVPGKKARAAAVSAPVFLGRPVSDLEVGGLLGAAAASTLGGALPRRITSRWCWRSKHCSYVFMTVGITNWYRYPIQY
jgi:hypothetical protein